MKFLLFLYSSNSHVEDSNMLTRSIFTSPCVLHKTAVLNMGMACQRFANIELPESLVLTWCDSSTLDCSDLFWTSPERTEVCFGTGCDVYGLKIPVGCHESFARVRKIHKKRNSVSFGSPRINFSAGSEYISALYENSMPPAGVSMEEAERIAPALLPARSRLNIRARAPSHNCLEVSKGLFLIEISGSNKVWIQLSNSPNLFNFFQFKSIDGRYLITEIYDSGVLKKFKRIGEALNGMNGMAIRVYSPKNDDLTQFCKDNILIEEYYEFQLNKSIYSGNASLFIRCLQITKSLHYRGLIHGNLEQSFVWDGFDSGSIRLSYFASIELFVDPVTHEHVSVDNCETDSDGSTLKRNLAENCLSRAVDMEDLGRLFGSLVKQLRSDTASGRVVAEFIQYTLDLGFKETPNYDEWIEKFQQLLN
jgi:hypothetical protein